MKTINLRWIYPHYRHDEFVEVSDEVWEVMRQAQREMNNYERRKVAKIAIPAPSARDLSTTLPAF